VNAFDEADALLVIDMQNSFLHPDGAMRAHRGRVLTDIDEIIKRNAEAVRIAHDRTLPVIYTRHCYRPGYTDAGARTVALFDSMGVSPLVAGSWDADLVDELRVDGPQGGAAPLMVDKTRMDAFYQTDLEIVLRGLGASRLLVGGIVTNACVETTVRAAAMRDLDVTVLADCCTTYGPEHQAAALSVLEFYLFARVSTLAEASAGP
jgi:ureidoacrylate peracid hydrolase